jgi:hypothetical protein
VRVVAAERDACRSSITSNQTRLKLKIGDTTMKTTTTIASLSLIAALALAGT